MSGGTKASTKSLSVWWSKVVVFSVKCLYRDVGKKRRVHDGRNYKSIKKGSYFKQYHPSYFFLRKCMLDMFAPKDHLSKSPAVLARPSTF